MSDNIVHGLGLVAPKMPLPRKRSTVDYSDEAVEQRKREAAAARQQAKQASAAWPDLDPLPEAERIAPEAFPLDALGDVLGSAALAISNDVQAPDSLAAGSVLATASLAAMAHADVQLPHGMRAPLSLFVVTAAESGDRKSATDAVALTEVNKVRNEQAREYQRERQSNDKAKPRSLTIAKPTVEGLMLMLKSQPTVGLFSPDGGEFLSGHSMREERRAAGLAFILKAWSGETLDSLTRGDGLSVLLGRRLTMHMLIQPLLLRQLLADPLAKGQGLLARCLIAAPETLAGTRKFRECNPVANPAIVRFQERIGELLRSAPSIDARGDGCELAPALLRLTAPARDLWVEFYNEVEARQAPGEDLEHARAWASKAAEHAARLAGIIQMSADPRSTEIDEQAMDGGMQAANFYLGEHVRLTGASKAERHFALLRMLADWIASRGRALSSDVLQFSPNPIRVLKAAGIHPLLDELAQRGYIRRVGDTWKARRDD